VICALLGLCNEDEAIEEGDRESLNNEKRDAAVDRLASEFESYPATLANVLLDGPPYYQDILQKRSGSVFTIHVVGASDDSELWEGHPDKSQERNVFQGYAEALAEVAERHRLKTVQLQFIGPECPKTNIDKTLSIPPMRKPKATCELKVTTLNGDYSKSFLASSDADAPDVVVFFNPGFTCPDYEWSEALATIGKGVPFLITTNTELEGVADVQYLLENDFIQELPPGLAEMLNGVDAPDDCEEENNSFFGINPYCGDRVRQSGTMANDLYVKSRWMFGGIFGTKAARDSSSKLRKKQKIEGSGNTKKRNPALV
jgi:hypothetical protein